MQPMFWVHIRIQTLSFKQYEFSLGSATAMVLFCCLFVVGLFYLRMISKEDD